MSDITHVTHSLQLLHKWQKQRKHQRTNRQTSPDNTNNPRIAVLEQLTSRRHRASKHDVNTDANDENKRPSTPHSAKLKLLKARHSVTPRQSEQHSAPQHDPPSLTHIRQNSSPHALENSALCRPSPTLPDRQQSLPTTGTVNQSAVIPPITIPSITPSHRYNSEHSNVKSPIKSNSTKPTSAGITRTNKHIKTMSSISPVQQRSTLTTLPALTESGQNLMVQMPKLPVGETRRKPSMSENRRKLSFSRTINQLRAEQLKIDTHDSSDSDDDCKQNHSSDEEDTEQIEYGYLMNKRRFTNWISHKQLLQQRKDSISATPTHGIHTPTAVQQKDSVTARLSKWAGFQVKMHQFVKQWRKGQTKPITSIPQLKRLESDFLSFDVTDQIMADTAECERVTDSPVSSLRGKQANIFSIDLTSSLDHMTVQEISTDDIVHTVSYVDNTPTHIRHETPIDSLAPIDLHDYIDISNDHTAEPAYDDILRYAKYLQFELPSDEPLLYVAKQALKSPVPHPWRLARAFNTLYYVNTDTQETQFTDPSDNYYFMLYQNERAKYWQQKLQQCFLNAVQQRYVNCSKMLITDTIFEYLCTMLSHNSNDVQCFDISHNLLTDVSVSKVCKLLLNNTHSIHTVNLSHNRIGAHSIIKLAKLCTSSTAIQHLNLSHNQSIGIVGVERIAKLLNDSQCNLQCLDISSIGITDESVQCLIDVLQFNKSLTELNVSYNAINSDNLDKLLKAAQLCKHHINVII